MENVASSFLSFFFFFFFFLREADDTDRDVVSGTSSKGSITEKKGSEGRALGLCKGLAGEIDGILVGEHIPEAVTGDDEKAMVWEDADASEIGERGERRLKLEITERAGNCHDAPDSTSVNEATWRGLDPLALAAQPGGVVGGERHRGQVLAGQHCPTVASAGDAEQIGILIQNESGCATR